MRRSDHQTSPASSIPPPGEAVCISASMAVSSLAILIRWAHTKPIRLRSRQRNGWGGGPLLGCKGAGGLGYVVSRRCPVVVVLMVTLTLRDVFVLTLEKNACISIPCHWIRSLLLVRFVVCSMICAPAHLRSSHFTCVSLSPICI